MIRGRIGQGRLSQTIERCQSQRTTELRPIVTRKRSRRNHYRISGFPLDRRGARRGAPMLIGRRRINLRWRAYYQCRNAKPVPSFLCPPGDSIRRGPLYSSRRATIRVDSRCAACWNVTRDSSDHDERGDRKPKLQDRWVAPHGVSLP